MSPPHPSVSKNSNNKRFHTHLCNDDQDKAAVVESWGGPSDSWSGPGSAGRPLLLMSCSPFITRCPWLLLLCRRLIPITDAGLRRSQTLTRGCHSDLKDKRWCEENLQQSPVPACVRFSTDLFDAQRQKSGLWLFLFPLQPSVDSLVCARACSPVRPHFCFTVTRTMHGF